MSGSLEHHDGRGWRWGVASNVRIEPHPSRRRSEAMESEWVEIWNCTWLHEARFLTSVLEAAGIRSMIPDEHTLDVQPFYAPALGGVRIIVPAQDAERAREVLASAPTFPDTDEGR